MSELNFSLRRVLSSDQGKMNFSIINYNKEHTGKITQLKAIWPVASVFLIR